MSLVGQWGIRIRSRQTQSQSENVSEWSSESVLTCLISNGRYLYKESQVKKLYLSVLPGMECLCTERR